jgi:hypothetical protein
VESKQRHILARSELRTLSDDVMQLVGILDGGSWCEPGAGKRLRVIRSR